MTLEEINSKYSWKELSGMPGDGEFAVISTVSP
jgi:hypothetical protein